MGSVYILNKKELQQLVVLDREIVDVVETAFTALGRGDVIMPPILSMDIKEANGEVDVKTAYLPGVEGFAIKVSPGFFDNPKLGLPSLNGLMILFSAQTGLVQALLLDNGYLTDVRTAAAGAVATRHLAPKNVHTAGVVGTGVQARLQMQAAFLERPFSALKVWGRNADKARLCAQDLHEKLGIDVQVEPNLENLVRNSQLVVTTTPSREALVFPEWLHPGLHITAMGSDQSGKSELHPSVLANADRVVCDKISQCEKLGELRVALDAFLVNKKDVVELGHVVSKVVEGRRTEKEITIADLTGTGAQDTVIANHAVKLARENQSGVMIES